MKAADLQDIVYTTLGDNTKVNFDNIFSFVPIYIPDAQTQIMFIVCIKESFTISFDPWSTDRKTVDTQLDYQVDVGSAQSIISPKYLIAVHQVPARIGVPNKANKVAIFDQLDVRKYHVDIGGVRYPRDGVNVAYGLNDYVDQNRDLKLFYREYVGEELLTPFISYPDMKNNYPFQIIDLSFQVDHINLKEMGFFEEYGSATKNAKMFIILIRHREIKMISEGNKITEVTVI